MINANCLSITIHQPGRVARRAGPARRSRHGVAMGSALRPGSQSAPTLKAQTDQRQLAGGRDLHSGERQLALPLPGGGFFRRDPRLPSLGQTGRGRSRALSDQSARQSKPSDARESSTPTSMPLTRCHLQLNRRLARGCSPRSLQLNAKNFCNEIVDFAVKS